MAVREDVHDRDGTFVLRKEIYRADDGTARYRELEPPDLANPTLDRAATKQEANALLATERSERTDTIRNRAGDALDTLRTIRDSSGDLTIRQLSNALRLMARVLIALIRLALRRLEGTD